ncbi:DUF1361 domain-containing protein [Pseudanabaena sp. FACHB-2040]|uniref:DUF1361 domain-containing protein n=1 Tax=Pseudanabaena sp. FACHB-2040 TaxID=2692859 RepID=UPI001682393F|nr:DUF1361 domain-containing protein [Pseudanabaena sp. FACHB-2040]MBD2257367.1 DUF1361 domain-containing protein [Pseudanabaena sp. FACHB-2040]
MDDLTAKIFPYLEVIRANWRWMGWNTVLALIPLGLAVGLFRRNVRQSILWWLGFALFFAFLPNAPYVLTDVVHLFESAQTGYSPWVVGLVMGPMYGVFLLIGFAAYVGSVVSMGRYVDQQGGGRWVTGIELGTHGLCAIAIYWGRFWRFNSWDLVTRPQVLLAQIWRHLFDPQQAATISLIFAGLALAYWAGKRGALVLVNKQES